MQSLSRLFAASLLATATTAAGAATFSYDYVEGGFGEVADAADADGIYLGGAHSLDKQFGLIGALGIIDYPGGDGLVLRGGGIFHKPLQNNLDLFGSIELVYSDYEFRFGPFGGRFDDDDIGVAAALGLRYAVQDNFQLEGKLTLTEVDPFDDGLGLLAGARYYIDRQLSAAAGIASDTEYDGIWINLRYDLK